MSSTPIDNPVAAPAPVETVTPIKPSEALRLGRVLYPVGCRGMLAVPIDGDIAVCATGAMAAARGWTPTVDWSADDVYRLIKVGLPQLMRHPRQECEFSSRKLDSLVLIQHLNDVHEWDTDQIATWLEGLGL